MFSYPSMDLQISIALLVASFIIGIITWAISRKWFLGLIVFSILGNLSFLGNIESRMFNVFHIVWLKYFSLFIWPLINIFLIIRYRKQRRERV